MRDSQKLADDYKKAIQPWIQYMTLLPTSVYNSNWFREECLSKGYGDRLDPAIDLPNCLKDWFNEARHGFGSIRNVGNNNMCCWVTCSKGTGQQSLQELVKLPILALNGDLSLDKISAMFIHGGEHTNCSDKTMYRNGSVSCKLVSDRFYQLMTEIMNVETCIICMDKEVNSKLIPCNHANMCADCACKVELTLGNRCPTCRAEFSQVQQIT